MVEGEGGVQGEYSEWCSKGLDRLHNAKIRTYIATLPLKESLSIGYRLR